MIYPVFNKKGILKFKIDTFLEAEEINNYEEIKSKLKSLGYTFSHLYNNIPMFVKNTICKSLGDLINEYNISFDPRQNKIPYKERNHLLPDPKLIGYKKYDRDKYKELKELFKIYKETKDPEILKKQISICKEMAQVVYNTQAPIIYKASQFYMLPEAAHCYFETIVQLGKKGDQLALTSNYAISTSSVIACILFLMRNVLNGYGGVYHNGKFQLLNLYGRALTKNLKPIIGKTHRYLSYKREEDEDLASVKDYLNYLDSYYEKLSRVTGDKYPKCKYIINEFGQLIFKVPSLIYYQFT